MSKNAKTKLNKEWDLTQFYKSPHDPRIDIDLDKTESGYKAFAKKYSKNQKYLRDANALLVALQDSEKLDDLPASKSAFYLHLYKSIDSQNKDVSAKLNLISERLSKVSNMVSFFSINLSKIPKNQQNIFLKNPKLKRYHYFLKKLFESGKHTLTEKEENLLSLKSLPSHSMWVDSFSKIKNNETIDYKKEILPISKAEATIREIPTQKERAALYEKLAEKYKALSAIAESELNAVVVNKKINDELRGFTLPYDATIMSYENDRKTILGLVDLVTKNFGISHRFYRVKAKMLGLNKLRYFDRAVPVGKFNKKWSFEDSYENLYKLFYSIDSEFGEVLKNFVDTARIDVYPKVGKTGGAYCMHQHGSPTYVLLNHTDNEDSMSTFAHEMGHAIHSHYAKSQGSIYESYSMSTAEVASTLFEQFLFYSEFEKKNDKEKIIALHDKIQDDVATIFRQIACFNFETEMHNTIRKNGAMSKEELASCMNKHMKAYLGEVFDINEIDGYFFVTWPHIREFFYVYSYAFGQLASKALYEKYKEDKDYIKKIKQFMSLGGSMSPEDIFKSIGVDVRKPDFWITGLKGIEKDIATLEKLVKKS